MSLLFVSNILPQYIVSITKFKQKACVYAVICRTKVQWKRRFWTKSKGASEPLSLCTNTQLTSKTHVHYHHHHQEQKRQRPRQNSPTTREHQTSSIKGATKRGREGIKTTQKLYKQYTTKNRMAYKCATRGKTINKPKQKSEPPKEQSKAKLAL